jgi:hypothetical protein
VKLENATAEQRAQFQRIEALQRKNQERLMALSRDGVSVNFFQPRMEFWIAELVKHGVVPEQVFLDINEAWEKELAEQLKGVVKQVKDARDKAMTQQKLSLPASVQQGQPHGGLIIPGN